MIDLSIIIVNFNTKDFLRRCLRSLLPNCPTVQLSTEIFVVDNASVDGSTGMVKQIFPQVKLMVNKKNLGFAKANNLGIRESQGRYVLLLNPDTIVPPETLPEMIRFMDENPQVGVSTCYVELASGGLDPACHRGFPTPWASLTYFLGLEKLFPKSRLFGQYHQTWKDLSKTNEIDSPVGSFYLVRRKVIKQVGLLDEDYFMYAEDIDWSYRIKKAGWKIIFYPHAKIIHYKGVASGMKKETQEIATADLETRIRATDAFFETMKLFYQKHYRGRYPRWLMALIFAGIDMMKWWRLRRLR